MIYKHCRIRWPVLTRPPVAGFNLPGDRNSDTSQGGYFANGIKGAFSPFIISICIKDNSEKVFNREI